MYEIKAIQTYYKGQVFRSRIEAKWAVFFDLMSIKWIYEPDGFELSTGKYLPDFFLPEYDCFVEIKPFYKKDDKQVKIWINKGEEVARLTNKAFLFLFGNPNLLPTMLLNPECDCNVLPFSNKYKDRFGFWFYTGEDIGGDDDFIHEHFLSEITQANSYQF